MAEVHKQNPALSPEMAQRFVQFVIMQTQNIYYVLGKIPSQDGRPVPPNLEAGKLFIDQLEMLQLKTTGNLSPQETKILDEALTNCRLAFVEASGGTPASMMPSPKLPKIDLDEELEDEPAPQPSRGKTSTAAASKPAAQEEHTENKKKFTKSYGA